LSDVFADYVVVANAHPRRFTLVFQILRLVANDAARMEYIVRTGRRQAREINVRPDDAVRAQFHALVNHGIRPDANGRIQLGLRMNDGGWMNHRVKVAHSA
jgi:hypothetical protein